MRDVILNEIIKDISKRYDKKREMIEIMVEKCKELDYNIDESKELIIDFFNV